MQKRWRTWWPAGQGLPSSPSPRLSPSFPCLSCGRSCEFLFVLFLNKTNNKQTIMWVVASFWIRQTTNNHTRQQTVMWVVGSFLIKQTTWEVFFFQRVKLPCSCCEWILCLRNKNKFHLKNNCNEKRYIDAKSRFIFMLYNSWPMATKLSHKV